MDSHLSQDRVKSESLPAESPRLPAFDAASSSSRLKSPSQPPLPSTETSDMTNVAAPSSSGAIKKKGTASVMKKAPKRPKSGTVKKPAKKVKGAASAGGTGSEEPGQEQEEAGSGDESDNGPYCICRGPDDHRWMICCENCEDWFHGECIHIDKDIGESLIEKFICPNCTKGSLTTLYKKTCGFGSCRKPARLAGGTGEHSVFCSDEHAGMWWERMVGRLPKSRSKAGLSDQLTQDELMALLSSGMASFDDEGNMKLAKVPFQEELPAMETTEGDGKQAH
jgi:COMPASS component SPP1